MDFPQIALHNAVAEPHPVYAGWLLTRYPDAVRNLLNTNARLVGSDSTMAELRFVTDAPRLRVVLSSLDKDSCVRVYRGVFEHSAHAVPAGHPIELCLDEPVFFSSVDRSILENGGWSPDVWRLVFDYARMGMHRIDTLGYSLRPPQASETPARRWLAYGSSITETSFFSYTGFAARELHADVANKGLAGACHIEAEAADYLASLEWDFATLELGVNLRGQAQAETFFEDRVCYLLNKLRASHPHQPIVLITVFTNRDRHMGTETSEFSRKQRFFDEVLHKVHSTSTDPNLHLINGNEIVDDASILGTDLLHPPPHGSARMGANLARLLRPILEHAGI